MELVTIQVNISAVVELTDQFLPQMQLRWSGSIINISAIVTSHSRYKKIALPKKGWRMNLSTPHSGGLQPFL